MKALRIIFAAALSGALCAICTVRAEAPADVEARIDQLSREVESLKQQVADQERKATAPEHGPVTLGENVILGGEGAAAYFDTQSEGTFPNNEFRIDEAKLFIDAKLDKNVFFYTELNLTQRELPTTDMEVGELYIDFEDLSRMWGGDEALTFRAGRFNIPFGEEYLTRDAIDNPLISHSLGDLWGVDEGAELFGDVGAIDYVVAVQNGSMQKLKDGDPDKAVVARIGANPHPQARVSLSAMRTGDIDVKKDGVAELWFGNDYLRPIGAPETTTKFNAEVVQGDAKWTWTGGHVAASAGLLQYDDNDTAADNSRDATYYAVEGVQDIVGKLYAGARYSAIHADDGYPVIGQSHYQVNVADELVDDIWRLSLGLGYRWSKQVLLKTEYSIERGDATDGSELDKQDQIAAEVAFGF